MENHLCCVAIQTKMGLPLVSLNVQYTLRTEGFAAYQDGSLLLRIVPSKYIHSFMNSCMYGLVKSSIS